MRDVAEVLILSVLLAAVLTTHAVILLGLLARRQSWRALAALLMPILAPYWAWQNSLRARAVAWVVLTVIYFLLLGSVALST